MIFWMVFMRALRRGDDIGDRLARRVARICQPAPLIASAPADCVWECGKGPPWPGRKKQVPAFRAPALAFGGTRLSESSSTRPARNRTPRSTKRERGGEATSPPRQPSSAATAVVPTCQLPPDENLIRLSGYRRSRAANASRSRLAASATAGNLRRTMPYLLPLPEEPAEEPAPAPAPAEPDEEPLSPPDCFWVLEVAAAPVPDFSLQS